jgi:hypothetical protein
MQGISAAAGYKAGRGRVGEGRGRERFQGDFNLFIYSWRETWRRHGETIGSSIYIYLLTGESIY